MFYESVAALEERSDKAPFGGRWLRPGKQLFARPSRLCKLGHLKRHVTSSAFEALKMANTNGAIFGSS